MYGVLNVYLKNRFVGQFSWESERNSLADELALSWPSPVYAKILAVIANQLDSIV